MPDPKLTAAATLMGEFGVDFTVDEAEQRVWAKTVMPSGDVFEISTRWVKEDSP